MQINLEGKRTLLPISDPFSIAIPFMKFIECPAGVVRLARLLLFNFSGNGGYRDKDNNTCPSKLVLVMAPIFVEW